MRKILIYLFIKFDGNTNKMFQEILEKNLGTTEQDVDDFFTNNNIDEQDYCTFIDSDFPDELKDNLTNPCLVFKR